MDIRVTNISHVANEAADAAKQTAAASGQLAQRADHRQGVMTRLKV